MNVKLAEIYDATKTVRKKPFDVSAITDTLMGAPLNVEIGRIINTPGSVIVKKNPNGGDEELVREIKSKFEVGLTYRSDMIVFINPGPNAF